MEQLQLLLPILPLGREPLLLALWHCPRVLLAAPDGSEDGVSQSPKRHVNEREEKARPVPVLDSSVYGRRIEKPVEELIRDHVRINHVQAEFYRKNGITCLVEKSNQSLDPI